MLLRTTSFFANKAFKLLTLSSAIISTIRTAKFVGEAYYSMEGLALAPSPKLTMNVADLKFQNHTNLFGYTGNVTNLVNAAKLATSYTSSELVTDATAVAGWMDARMALSIAPNDFQQDPQSAFNTASKTMTATLIGSTITYGLRLAELNVKESIESHKKLLEALETTRAQGMAAIKTNPALGEALPVKQMLTNISAHALSPEKIQACQASFVPTSHAQQYANNLLIYGPQLVIDLWTASWGTIANIGVLIAKFAEDDWKANNARDYAVHNLECTLGRISTSSESLMTELLIWNKYVLKNESAIYDILPQSQGFFMALPNQTSYLFYSAAGYPVTQPLSANWEAAKANIPSDNNADFKSHIPMLNQPSSSSWDMAMKAGAALGYALEYAVNTALVAGEGAVQAPSYISSKGMNVLETLYEEAHSWKFWQTAELAESSNGTTSESDSAVRASYTCDNAADCEPNLMADSAAHNGHKDEL